MIISASRRTDIPAFYSEWFFRRAREGFAIARNPRNPNQSRRIELTPDAVDAIVFWTKNPAPMLPRLHELRDFMYYFQFTITPYGRDVEAGLPDKVREIVPAFLRLAHEIGPERVIWRYDPILVNTAYQTFYHAGVFQAFARMLKGATKRVVISFLDTSYREVRRNLGALAPAGLTDAQKLELAAQLAQAARENGMEISACAQPLDMSPVGISGARCVDGELIEKLLGKGISAKPHKGQRELCGCSASVDIGAYNTCRNGCRYCYASFNSAAIASNAARHDADSPFLLG